MAEDSNSALLLHIVRETLTELNRDSTHAARATLDSAFDQDLGLDSLARVELLLRVERAFGLVLPEDMLQRAETPRDLLTALQSARPAQADGAPAAATEAQQQRVTPNEVAESEPAAATTLVEVLDWHIAAHPDRTHIVYLSDGGEEEISYAALRARSTAAAAALQAHGLEHGQTVAIMLPTSPEYFYTYFGILLAGGIPVPIYPPARLSQLEEHVRRHAGILANAQATMLVTVPEAMPVARLLRANVPGLEHVLTAAALTTTGGRADPVEVTPENIAFIQYTSGSTGSPKGVVLTHANLLANIRTMARVLRADSRDVFVSWLPLYHDMGLIGAWLGSLYAGCKLVIMSPLAFLARPERWLWAIHRFRGTLSAGPNFAYELCLQRVKPAQIEGLELSSWRCAFNGAEAVSPDTIRRFSEHYAPYGLAPTTMTPVYGLAECSVGLLFPPLGRIAPIDVIERDTFVQQGKAVPAAPDDPNPLRFPGCGRPIPGHDVRIVDDTGLEVGERVEGRLEFRGPSATSGYYRNPGQTKRLFRGDWLDSGDRAYLADGDIYITGRVKDIIIRGGRNIHPEEIEGAVGALEGVRKGCVAVFGAPDPQTGTERLVVAAETRERDTHARSALRSTIVKAVTGIIGEPPDDVVLASPHTVLKTSSGKIRRSGSRELYEQGRLDAPSPSVAGQFARLALHAFVPQLRRVGRLVTAVAYGAYVYLLFALIAPVTWLLSAMTRKPSAAWAIGRRSARLFFALCGIRLVVRGVENVPRGQPGVLVANHASYLDGIIVCAAIPEPHRFVAKRELKSNFISRIYLRKLGTEFVERFDTQQSVEAANRFVRLASHAPPLAFFPEGTFTRAPGLMPFRLGAFTAAVQAQVPVLPVAIRGARSVLRGGQWLPRRNPIVVTVGTPVAPEAETADTFSAAIRLRDAARAQILEHCAEPDLGTVREGPVPRNKS
jgi:acyl carrier protein